MVARNFTLLGIVLALACVLVLTQAALAADEQVEGKIKNMALADNKVIVTDKAGKDWTFHIDDGTKVRVNGANGQMTDLKAGDEVFVTHLGEAGSFLATDIRAQRK